MRTWSIIVALTDCFWLELLCRFDLSYCKFSLFLLHIICNSCKHAILYGKQTLTVSFCRTILRSCGHFSTFCCQIFLIRQRIFLSGSTNRLRATQIAPLKKLALYLLAIHILVYKSQVVFFLRVCLTRVICLWCLGFAFWGRESVNYKSSSPSSATVCA